ncbi:MAG: DUF1186 domain-containing protein, partial [Flavisolibacter sp.]|nr:DUF1186 domain-containing protein [Flavisolibacter sp.]
MLLIFQDHQNRSIQLTDDTADTDAPHKIPQSISPLLEKAGQAIYNRDKHIEKKLKKWIEENPGVPQLKNYLTVYYSLRGHNEKAFEYNHKIAAQHPDYLFAKLNLAVEYISRKELEKVPDVLGQSLDLLELYPHRKVFHVSEYNNFYKTVVKYWCEMKQPDKAETILNDLEKLERDLDADLGLEELQTSLILAGADRFVSSLKESEDAAVVRAEPTLPQTTEAPTFHFPQIQWLYDSSFNIEKGKIAELLCLVRSLLIKDLTTVDYDAIRRYSFFYEQDYQPETHDFIVHALLLLQELEAQEGLPAVLEFLRQPEELLDYWLSDLLTENIWQVVYATGKDQLPVLEDFLKEPLNYTYARSSVSTAISQLALHQPERREEVIALYKRLLAFYYENKDNAEIFDLTLTSFVLGDIIDFNGRELTDEIKHFYEEELVDEYIEGDWEDAKEEMETDDADREFSRKRKLQDIYEIIDELHGFEKRVKQEEQDKT